MKPEAKKVLQLLREIEHFPHRKDNRYNIKPPGQRDRPYYGFTLGRTVRRDKGPYPSKYNRVYPALWRAAKQLMRAYDPAFRFTTVQVNRNQKCRMHVDCNNRGPSYIIGLGDYTGGGLRTQGKTHDVHNRFFKFDGRVLHGTTPFRGERYTLVFFSLK